MRISIFNYIKIFACPYKCLYRKNTFMSEMYRNQTDICRDRSLALEGLSDFLHKKRLKMGWNYIKNTENLLISCITCNTNSKYAFIKTKYYYSKNNFKSKYSQNHWQLELQSQLNQMIFLWKYNINIIHHFVNFIL